MAAIRLLAAHDLRRRWRSTLAIALLTGTLGAVVIAGVAGARRSASALRRFNDQSRSSQLQIDVGLPTAQQLRTFEAEAGSPAVGLIHAYGISPLHPASVAVAADVDDSWGTAVDRPRVIKGRLADPNAVDEVTISEALAAQADIGLGSVLQTQSLRPEDVANGTFDPKGPQPRLRVVGIVRRPADLSDIAGSGGVITVTPAFDRAYRNKIALFTLTMLVRVDGGEPAIARTGALARRMFGSSESFRLQDESTSNNGAHNAIGVLTAGIWIFVVVAAAAALFALGVVLVRDSALDDRRQPTLRALGLTRLDRIAIGVPRALVMAALGGALAVAGAIALSPLFPLGIARRADPEPGFHADWFALALGGVALGTFVLVVALAAAFRATRVDVRRLAGPRSRLITDALRVNRLSPAMSNGVRMAVDAGRDDRAVPVRSAFVGAVLGVVGIAAILVFAASLADVVHTPRRYGWTWDIKIGDATQSPRCNDSTLGVDRLPALTDFAVLCERDVSVDGRDLNVWAFTSVRGSIAPAIVSGRAPAAPDEVALGRVTLDALHKRLGDNVNIVDGTTAGDFRVVGRAIFPQLRYGDVQPLADGAVVTGPALSHLHPAPSDATTRFFVARVRPGADLAGIERDVLRLPAYRGVNVTEVGEPNVFGGPSVPPEVDRLRHVSWLPPTLAILLSTVALIAMAHALVTAGRRRRRELAILKALGFSRRQVRSSLAWQATTIAAAGLVLGIPLGVVAGRLAWSAVARNVGIAPTIALPTLAFVVLVPLALVLVNAVAYLPARSVARTPTAAALARE